MNLKEVHYLQRRSIYYDKICKLKKSLWISKKDNIGRRLWVQQKVHQIWKKFIWFRKKDLWIWKMFIKFEKNVITNEKKFIDLKKVERNIKKFIKIWKSSGKVKKSNLKRSSLILQKKFMNKKSFSDLIKEREKATGKKEKTRRKEKSDEACE